MFEVKTPCEHIEHIEHIEHTNNKPLLISDPKTLGTMADHVECVGMSSSEMREEKRRRLLEKRAYNSARLKAESEDRRMDEVLRQDEERIFTLIPDKDFIASYFLEERSLEMKKEDLRYRFNVPMSSSDPEVTLQLWRRDQITGEEILQGEVGDLYSLELMSPGGDGSLNINIIVESSESRRRSRSMLYYSVYDIGHQERAYSIPGEAWFTYLMFREDDPGNRAELDARLLFIAIGDRSQLSAYCTLAHFMNFTIEDIIQLMQAMTPGKVYERPTSEEASLAMRKNGGEELLRSDSIDGDKESCKVNLEERFDDVEVEEVDLIDYDQRVTRSKLRQKQPRVEDMARSLLTPKKKELLRKVVADAMDPESEENVTSREIWRQCLEAEKLMFPTFSRKKPTQDPKDKEKMDGRSCVEREEDMDDTRSSSPSSEDDTSPPGSPIDPYRLEPYGFLTFVDDVGLIEVKKVKEEEEGLEVGVKTSPTGDTMGLHQDDDDPRDDSKDFMPEDEWELQEMPNLTSEAMDDEEAAKDDSFPFNDSMPEMFKSIPEMFLAKPVNESQIVTLESSESSVTDNDPEESMYGNCRCMTDTSRDFIDDDDEELDEEIDFLYIPEV